METTLSKPVCVLIAAACFSASAYSASYSISNVPDADPTNDSATIGGAIFKTDILPSGTGNFTQLFKVSGNKGDTEQAYNYDGTATKPFDQGQGSFNPHLELGSVPVVTINGVQYLQFLIDSDDTRIVRDFRVYRQSDPNNTAQPILVTSEANLGNLGTLVYGLNTGGANDLSMKMQPGNGSSDFSFNVPLSMLGNSVSANDNIYIWLQLDRINGTFTEVAINKVGVPVTYSSLVPEPGTVGGGLTLLALAASGRLRRRNRQPQHLTPTEA